MTHTIVSRPWKQGVVNDFAFQLYHQVFALFAEEEKAEVPAPGEDLSRFPL